MWTWLKGLMTEPVRVQPEQASKIVAVLPQRVPDISEPVLAIVKELENPDAWKLVDWCNRRSHHSYTLEHTSNGFRLKLYGYGLTRYADTDWMTSDEQAAVGVAFIKWQRLTIERAMLEQKTQQQEERQRVAELFNTN